MLPCSSEGERKSLDSWIIEFNCEAMIGDGSLLPDQLIQAMVRHHAIALCVRVHTMIVTGRLAVNGHPEVDRLPVDRRTKYEMQIAGMKMEHDLPAGRLENRDLSVKVKAAHPLMLRAIAAATISTLSV
jgi:hypothetical protein